MQNDNSQPMNNPQPTPPSKGTGLVGLMNSIPEKLMKVFKKQKDATPPAQTLQSVPQQNQTPQITVPQSIKKLPVNPKKLLLIGGGILIIIILLSVILNLMKPKGVALIATPSPVPVEPVATSIPTKYATDSAVLQLEENIKILDQNLNNTDLREEAIQPRQLDWTITFR